MCNTTTFKRYLYVLLVTSFIQAPLAHSARIELQPNSIYAGTGDSISLNQRAGGFCPDSLGAFDISDGI